MDVISNLDRIVTRIQAVRREVPRVRSVLVAISGIDGCGKGYWTERIVALLRQRGLRPAGIGVDGWLNLPHVRFDPANPAEHFYGHAIRFDELFAQLVLPLRRHRSLCIEADYTEETATTYRKQRYEFRDVDVIVLEGIYLLKRELVPRYDLTIWVECGFDTALERAVARAQESLSPEQTVRAYRTIYFPAQRIHFDRDDPRSRATLILPNDASAGHPAAAAIPRLTREPEPGAPRRVPGPTGTAAARRRARSAG